MYVDIDNGRRLPEDSFQKTRSWPCRTERERVQGMSDHRVGYIIGSLSTESINRTLARALIRLVPKNLKFVEIPIRDLPLYNRDFDTDYPPDETAKFVPSAVGVAPSGSARPGRIFGLTRSPHPARAA
jgi:hypothetical protein